MQKAILILAVTAIASLGTLVARIQFGDRPENSEVGLASVGTAIQGQTVFPAENIFEESEQPKETVTAEKVEKVEVATPPKEVKKTSPALKPAERPKAPEPKTVAPDAPFKFDPAWKDAVVDLYCAPRYSDSIINISSGSGMVSGSGVVIDPRGIILTNAHSGWRFLFADWPNPSLFNCSIRIGSPAEPRYRATLLYLPKGWFDNDIAEISKYIPHEDKAYGKDDYALLVITKGVDPNTALPTSFPFLHLDARPLPPPGSAAYVVAYPASVLSFISTIDYIPLIASPTAIDSMHSIKNSNTLDILAFKGMIASQHGFSGGAVITAGGKLSALQAFFDEGSQDKTTSDSVMNAITIDYINRDLKEDTGFSLAEFIARDTPQAISDHFLNNTAVDYRIKYVKEWQKKRDILIPGVDYTTIGQECVWSCALEDINPSLWE